MAFCTWPSKWLSWTRQGCKSWPRTAKREQLCPLEALAPNCLKMPMCNRKIHPGEEFSILIWSYLLVESCQQHLLFAQKEMDLIHQECSFPSMPVFVQLQYGSLALRIDYLYHVNHIKDVIFCHPFARLYHHHHNTLTLVSYLADHSLTW